MKKIEEYDKGLKELEKMVQASIDSGDEFHKLSTMVTLNKFIESNLKENEFYQKLIRKVEFSIDDEIVPSVKISTIMSSEHFVIRNTKKNRFIIESSGENILEKQWNKQDKFIYYRKEQDCFYSDNFRNNYFMLCNITNG